MPQPSSSDRASLLLLDECFAQEDGRFLETLRTVESPKFLAGFAEKWKKEQGAVAVGSSKRGGRSKSVTMNDTPSTPWAREGLGDVAIEFETVAMVLETAEPLGALKWGFKIRDEAKAPIERSFVKLA